MLLDEGVCSDECIVLAKLCQSLPCFILYSKAKLACYSRYLLTSYFRIPGLLMKRTFVFFFWFSSRRSFRPSQNCSISAFSAVVIGAFSSVQSLSRVQLVATPWIAPHQASLSIASSQSLPKLMSIESVMQSNHLILCRPLLLLPSIFPSIRVFSNESALCTRWPNYQSFSFNISPSNEHTGLISFRMDWLDLLAVQGTLKSLLQHHSSKISILWHSEFFIVQLSHPYMTTGKDQP